MILHEAGDDLSVGNLLALLEQRLFQSSHRLLDLRITCDRLIFGSQVDCKSSKALQIAFPKNLYLTLGPPDSINKAGSAWSTVCSLCPSVLPDMEQLQLTSWKFYACVSRVPLTNRCSMCARMEIFSCVVVLALGFLFLHFNRLTALIYFMLLWAY